MYPLKKSFESTAARPLSLDRLPRYRRVDIAHKHLQSNTDYVHMRATIALGGNALLRRSQPLDTDVQRANLREAVAVLAEIARDRCR
jgi:hypothetical protein